MNFNIKGAGLLSSTKCFLSLLQCCLIRSDDALLFILNNVLLSATCCKFVYFSCTWWIEIIRNRLSTFIILYSSMDTVYSLEVLADLYDKQGIPGSDELRAEAAEGRAVALQGLPEAEVVSQEYVRLSRPKA